MRRSRIFGKGRVGREVSMPTEKVDNFLIALKGTVPVLPKKPVATFLGGG